MHVLLVPSEYPTNDHKLGGIFTQEQEKYLSKNHKLGVIYIYLFSVKKIFSTLFFKIFSSEKIKKNKMFLYFPRIPYFKLINYNIHYFLFLKVFKQYIYENGKPDLLHVHFSEFSIWTAYKIKKSFNIPYILTEHSTDFLDGKYLRRYKKNSNVYQKIHLSLKNTKKIICVSKALKNKIKYIFKLKDNKLVVIPNLSLNIKYKSKKKLNDIIFVGSLEERKNPILLLKAFEKVYNNNLNMKIIGDGDLRNQIIKFINDRKLNKFVKIYKNLSRRSVIKSIGDSRILVLPSFYETFGIVVIEAYSMGVPVIMTDSYGVRDVHNPDCSIIVKNNNVTELSEAISKIFKNYNKFKHSKIKNFYMKNFSSNVIIKKIEKIYKI